MNYRNTVKKLTTLQSRIDGWEVRNSFVSGDVACNMYIHLELGTRPGYCLHRVFERYIWHTIILVHASLYIQLVEGDLVQIKEGSKRVSTKILLGI